jgi:protein-S-isoprenylcysteine O-methyltransferase Ste14
LLLLLKNLLFTVVVPGTVAVYVPLLMTRGQRLESAGAPLVAGALLLTGMAIYSWCLWDFASFGRGTPAPMDAPKRLVARGLYRHTRNPMYLGVLCTILGWAVLFRADQLLLYALGIGLCFHLFVVLYEEPHLQKTFGASYEEYRSRVNRWLPKIARRPNARGSEPTT